MALQEQRKSAQFQYITSKQADVVAMVQVEQKMEDAVAHYEQITLDLNAEKQRYADLALQLQSQSEHLLQKLQQHDKAKNEYTRRINSLTQLYSSTKKKTDVTVSEKQKYQKEVQELLVKLEAEQASELKAKQDFLAEKEKETAVINNMTALHKAKNQSDNLLAQSKAKINDLTV